MRASRCPSASVLNVRGARRPGVGASKPTGPFNLLSADTSEQIIQGHEPAESTDLFIEAVSPQQVAYASMRADDAQLHAAAREVKVQLVQHARAGEIDMR